MALTTEEIEAVAYHLGYPNTERAPGLPGSFATSGPMAWAFQSAVTNLKVGSEPFVRRCIEELQCIEDQMSSSRRELGVKRVGNIELDMRDAEAELEVQYINWADKLADALGVPVNPLSQHHNHIRGGHGVIEPC